MSDASEPSDPTTPSEQKDIDGSISSMGYGYNLKVLINGKDIGIKGGMSEGKRLFSVEHSLKDQMAPEISAQLCVLKPGENTVHMEYSKTGTAPEHLTVDVYLDAADPVVKLDTTEPSGVLDQTFTA